MSHARYIPLLATTLLAATSTLLAGPRGKYNYEPDAVANMKSAQGAAATNLLKGSTATASGHWDVQTPAKAIDGDRRQDSHWACESLPVWHQVDMGEPRSIGSIRVWPYWSDGRVYQYKVEGSRDGKSWTLLADATANTIASSEAGDTYNFAPANVRYLRTTFLSNSRGKANGGHLVEIEAYGQKQSSALVGAVGSVDDRYPPAGIPDGLAPASKGIRLWAWRGERVNAQILVTSSASHTQLRAGSRGLASPAGGAPIKVQTNFVRQVLADGKPMGDILDTAESLDLPAGTNRAVWVSIDVPANATSGIHKGSILVVSTAGRVEFPVQLEILPCTLPPPARWSMHVDIWQHPDAVARWHDVPEWSREHLDLMRPLMRRLADAGQKTITCTLIDEAWNGQTYDKFGSMVEWRRRSDGSWTYDYSVFDKWVAFMSDECNLGHARIHCYTMIPWSLSFRFYDEAKGSHDWLKLRPGSPEYDAHWGRFLKDFTAHLKSKGWLGRTVIGMDERPDDLMRGALATLAKHAPELKVASAIDRPSKLMEDVQDISVALQHIDELKPEILAERRRKGMKSTFYVCTGPARPNTFTFSPPAESEWLGLLAAAHGTDGFLRWAWNSWVEDPLESTDFTKWPSGDCFLVYPGNRSSIRFERLRDGFEDFEKIALLRTQASKGSPELRKAVDDLDALLKTRFTWARGQKAGPHAEDVRLANEAILNASRLATPGK